MNQKEISELQQHKQHVQKGGRRAKDIKLANIKSNPKNPNQNMKAFSVQHVNKTRLKIQKQAQLAYTVQSEVKDKNQQQHPLIAFIGSKNTGKTTLVNSVLHQLTHRKIKQENNVVTVHIPNSTQPNISFYDTPDSLEAVIDISKIASHIVLVININIGIQLEHFEYLSALQSLNWGLVTVVLTYCDQAHNFIKQRKAIKDRLEKEIATGLKLYIANYEQKTGLYDSTNMQLLSRHLTTKCGTWNNFIKQNPAILISNIIQQGNNYLIQGFVHGNTINKNDYFIMPGVNYEPFQLQELQVEKNPLEQQDKLLSNKTEIYAPMSQIDDLVVNKQWIQIQQQNKKDTQIQKIDLDSDEDDGMQLFAGEQIIKGQELLENIQQDDEQIAYESNESIEQEDSLDSGSTDTNLDNFDLDNMIQNGEEVEEVDEYEDKIQKVKELNLSEKVVLLPQPQSLLQYEQSIYRYYKQKNVQKQQNKQQNKQNNLLKLFDDIPDTNTLYLDVIDQKCQLQYINTQYQQYIPTDLNIQIQDKDNFYYYTYNSQITQADVKHLFINDQTQFIEQLNEQLDQYINQLTQGSAQPENETTSSNQQNTSKFMQQFQISDQYLQNQQKQLEQQKQLANLMQIENNQQIEQTSFISCKININLIQFSTTKIPLILAKANSSQRTYNTIKLRHHRWYPLPLKSTNGIFVVAGWYRFQSPIVYGSEIVNKETLMTSDQQTQMALRYLKYTPNAMHCYGTCFGPQLNAGTHVILINKFNEKGWRIAANGIVYSSNPTSNIYKKLKLIGTVKDIWKNTVYSGDLFTTVLEGRAFIGCGVETISKIRGIIKGVQGTKQGMDDEKDKKQEKETKCITRIMFEDKIRRNDLIILKTQVKFKIQQLSIDYLNYNKNKQQYMRMAYEIRQQDNKPLLIKSDTRFLTEQEEQQYEHVTFADRELQLKQKEIKALPFEQQVNYLKKMQQLKEERQSTNLLIKPKKLKNQVLNDLLQSETSKQERMIAEMKSLDQYVKNNKDKQQAQQKYSKDQWEKGMNKQKDQEKKEKLKEKQKRKRFMLEKIQQKEKQKHQI